MTWAWTSIARGRTRSDDVLVISSSDALQAFPTKWRPRRRREHIRSQANRTACVCNSIHSYRIMGLASRQKKHAAFRAPICDADRVAAQALKDGRLRAQA